MKTIIPFLHKTTNVHSNCGDPLKISLSSRDLDWDGVLVERGVSPYFHPKDVVTPNFYFAIEMKNTFEWEAVKEGEFVEITTEPGDIWVNPPFTPFTHNIDVPCDFLIVNISKKNFLNTLTDQFQKRLSF